MNLHKKIESLENKAQLSISLIASESLLYPHIRECYQSNLHEFTLEGSLHKRYFPIPEEVNEIETFAQQEFRRIYGMDYCDLRPTSATHANISAYLSVMKPNDTVLAMNLTDGGHLSH